MSRTIDFIFEIDSLRFIKRQWNRFLNPDFANITEHTFRIIWLSLIICQLEKDGNTIEAQIVAKRNIT